jgi:hypothetical protein
MSAFSVGIQQKMLLPHVGVYAAITNIHLTEPQVRQGGKVSVLDSGILEFFPLSLQKCSYNPDSGHFSPVR